MSARSNLVVALSTVLVATGCNLLLPFAGQPDRGGAVDRAAVDGAVDRRRDRTIDGTIEARDRPREQAARDAPGDRPADAKGADAKGADTKPVVAQWSASMSLPPGANVLRGVWGGGPNDVWVVGDSTIATVGIIAHWTGSWSVPYSSTGSFNAVTGQAGAVCAVGSGASPGLIAIQPVSSPWITVSLNSPLHAVWCASSKCYAVGDGGAIVAFDLLLTPNIVPISIASLGQRRLNGIWGQAASAACLSDAGDATHPLGKLWQCDLTAAPPTCTTIYTSSQGALWSVTGTSPQEVFVVGAGEGMRVYNGTPMSFVATSDTLKGVWTSASGAAKAVGLQGAIYLVSTPITGVTSADLFAIWGSSGTDLWAVGDNVIVRYQ